LLKNNNGALLIHYANSIFFDVHFRIPLIPFLSKHSHFKILKKKINYIESNRQVNGLYENLNLINYFKLKHILEKLNYDYYFEKDINILYFDIYLRNNNVKNLINKTLIKLISRIDYRFNLFNLLILK